MLFEIYALTIYQKIIYIMKETQRHIRIMNKTWKWSSIKSTSGLFVACTSKTRCRGFLMSRPTFRRDFDFGPTSRKYCFRTHD